MDERGRLRVLMTTSDLGGGGGEREFANLARHLPRDAFDTHLCLWRPDFVHQPPPDLPVHVLPKSRPWHTPRVVRDFAELVDRLKPEVVYSQLRFVNLVVGSALRCSHHKPRWIPRLVNDPSRDFPGPLRIWARRVFPSASIVLGACEGLAAAASSHLGLTNVGHLPNVIDLAEIDRLARMPTGLERDRERFIVVHAGRMVAQKNQAMLLKAFATLRGRPAELWVLGDGPLKPRLEATARSLGIQGQVRWLGYVQNPYPLIKAADCLALSSDHEGLPNVVIEAMVCGTTVVATRCRFGPEDLIQHGQTGLLSPPGDTRAFADHLNGLAVDPVRNRELGERAQRAARERFDTSRVVAAYAEVFTGRG